MSRHFEFFNDLRSMPFGQAQIVDGAKMRDIVPPYWKDERVASPEDWFIRTGRGLGLCIQYVLEKDYFIVTHDYRGISAAGQR